MPSNYSRKSKDNLFGLSDEELDRLEEEGRQEAEEKWGQQTPFRSGSVTPPPAAAAPGALPTLPTLPSLSVRHVDEDGEGYGEGVDPLTDSEAASHKRFVQAVTPSPAPTLVALSRSEDWQVRAALAANSDAPDYVLASLASDKNPMVRANVIENVNTSDDTYATFVTDRDLYVAQTYIAHPRTSVQQLESMTRGSDDIIAMMAQDELSTRV